MPPPIPISARLPSRLSPRAIAPAPSRTSTVPIRTRRRNVASGSATSSRSAAIGAIRAARRAGSRAAIAVTPTPDGVGPEDRLPGHREGGPAQVQPEDPEQPPQPEREQVADAQARRRPDQPHDGRLDEHGAVDLPARGAHRAQQRQLTAALGDQDREGVDDDEDPDDERDAGEDEQEGLEEAEDLVEVGLVLLDEGVPRAGDHAGRQDLLGRLRQLGLGDPGSGVQGDRAVDVASAVEPLLHEPGVEDRQGGAVQAAGTELDEPGELGLHHGRSSRRRELDGVADLELALLGGVHVERDLVRAGRIVPTDEAEDGLAGERLGLGRVEGQAGWAVAADHLAVLADHEHGLQGVLRARPTSTSGQLLEVSGDAGREGAVVLAGVEVVGTLEGDLDVRGAALDDVVERAAHGVGEDHRARDEGDAEDDRERGEQQAQLAGDQVAPGHAPHVSGPRPVGQVRERRAPASC